MAAVGAYGGPQSLSDVLSLLGAGLKDASPNSQGGNLMGAQQMLMQRAQYMRQQQMLAGLFGGQSQAQAPPAPAAPAQPQSPLSPGMATNDDYAGAAADQAAGIAPPAPTAPTALPPSPAPYQGSPLSLDNPKLPAMAAIYKAMGIDLAPSIEALKAAQPDVMYDRGFGYNKKSGAAMGGFHPDLGQGIGLTPNGAQVLPGYADAVAQISGATEGAKAQAQSNYDLVDVPMSDGSSVKLPRGIAVQVLTQRAVNGGAPAGGVGGVAPGTSGGAQLGVSQSPAAAKLAETRAGNQGQRESDIAGAHSAMQQVDDQTNMIAQNLHDMLGETQDPKTGQWVKTKPSMIGKLSTGSGTDVIEHIPFLNQQAKDLQAKIETVRNGTSFNSLQAIKNALSAAGDGGQGSIRMTDQTARMLGEINGSLNQDQSGPQFEATVRRHLGQLEELNKARHDLFASQYQGVRPTTPGQTVPTANYNNSPSPGRPSPPQPGAVVRGYRYMGGDPASPQSWSKLQ
jgi:hypothetical protein